ncbi:hypothetical protein HYPSUDRAFT_138699 [Hypholoma sublateritium FD-334 SS-4]|uniref:UbiA prenyltransferase n=1 Tax=Hypholoma sublateritium (strain FD-334 SS-4) TaxID=945553 RepID=A0A0D2MGU6_HYPSF|nr:hypothetical protein HYPSUDRAFT_138699 [Hypholoma sublateritium FD-334 SS-4]
MSRQGRLDDQFSPTSQRLIRFYYSSHIHTILLFTWTDYKTIFLPITIFAITTSPYHSSVHLLQACLWTWIHGLLCNVSNQVMSRDEDTINHPWRPLPAGRVTQLQALQLRWFMVALCILWSTTYGKELTPITLSLITLTFLYDEVGLSSHPFGKNACNACAYAAFEFGAVTIMGNFQYPDHISETAVALSAMVILTTIQAQDFQDVEGDLASKRITFPIYAPEFSRLFTFLVIPLWTVGLVCYWNVGWLVGMVYIALGIIVGVRYYYMRSRQADRRSYLFYNVRSKLSS